MGKNNGCLFYDEIILDGFDPFDAACDLARLIDSSLRINEAAQLNDAFALYCYNINKSAIKEIMIFNFEIPDVM
jgi:hypothetical protein